MSTIYEGIGKAKQEIVPNRINVGILYKSQAHKIN